MQTTCERSDGGDDLLHGADYPKIIAWMDWLLRSPDLGSTIVPVNDAWHGGPRMLVLGVARFRPGVQHQHEEHRAAFNAHLMQPLNPRIRLAGPMFEPSGAPSGVFMLFETDTIETLHRFLSQSPYAQADMLERLDFDVVQVEVGHF